MSACICLLPNCTAKQIFLVLSIMHLARVSHNYSPESGEREIECNECQLWRQALRQVQLHEAEALVSYFKDRETEAQRAWATCPNSHSWCIEVLGSNLGRPGFLKLLTTFLGSSFLELLQTSLPCRVEAPATSGYLPEPSGWPSFLTFCPVFLPAGPWWTSRPGWPALSLEINGYALESLFCFLLAIW